MKYWIIILLAFTFTSLQAQKIEEFEFVYVPDEFEDFAKDNYQLDTLLKISLRKKNFEIITPNTVSTKANNNPCSIAHADIKRVKNAFRNVVELIFVDCNQNEIARYKGTSPIKEFEKGYQDALKRALEDVNNQNLNSNTNIVLEPKKLDEAIIVATVDSKNEFEYKNDNKTFYRVNTTNSNFNLLNSNNEVVAEFYSSTIPNVYHVTIINDINNYQTIGYLKDNTIIIEYKVGKNIWKTSIFTLK